VRTARTGTESEEAVKAAGEGKEVMKGLARAGGVTELVMRTRMRTALLAPLLVHRQLQNTGFFSAQTQPRTGS